MNFRTKNEMLPERKVNGHYLFERPKRVPLDDEPPEASYSPEYVPDISPPRFSTDEESNCGFGSEQEQDPEQEQDTPNLRNGQIHSNSQSRSQSNVLAPAEREAALKKKVMDLNKRLHRWKTYINELKERLRSTKDGSKPTEREMVLRRKITSLHKRMGRWKSYIVAMKKRIQNANNNPPARLTRRELVFLRKIQILQRRLQNRDMRIVALENIMRFTNVMRQLRG